MPESVDVSEARRELIESYLRAVPEVPAERRTIAPRASRGPVPLSHGQEQIWLHSRMAAGVPLYNEPVTVCRTGPLDPGALRRALNEIIRRHEAWRTVFVEQDGQPLQVIQPSLEIEVPVVDLEKLPPQDRVSEAVRLASEDARRPFDLARGPLIRARLFRLGDQEHRLALTIHHLIFDGISIYRVFIAELAALYDAFSRGKPSPLAELPIQYGDFAAWQRQPAREDAVREHLAYWKKQLGGELPVLELPVDRPRPAVQSHRGAVLPFSLPASLHDALKELSQRERATFFMTLQAAVNAFLYRYTGQEDILIGAPSAGRNRPEVQKLLGLFINTLVLRTRFTGDLTFRELLAKARETTLGALCHCEAPFELVVKEVQPRRDAGRTPLFQLLFSMVPAAGVESGGWSISQFGIDPGVTKCDLVLEMQERPEGIDGRLIYSTDLFERRTAARMVEHFETLLESIAAQPDAPISDLAVARETERRRVLVDWNATAREYPSDRSVHDLFSEQAARTPEATALVSGDRTLTYAELDRRSNQLARHLRGLAVGPGSLVGVSMARSIEMIVGLLAILKAGGAYVPLDSSYPADRLNFMIRDAGLKVILKDPLPPEAASESAEALPDAAGGERPAYVMYTSGTTGRPKGVLVPHRGIVRLVRGADYAHFGPDEVFLQLAPVSFDASTFEIWGALLNGGRLVLMPPGKASLEEIGQAIRRHGVTTLWLTAGLFHLMVDERLEDLRPLRQLLAGGDVLSPAHVRLVLETLPELRLINGYGPTESTTFTCCHTIARESLRNGAVPIGRPIANTTVYLLDAKRRPVPVGVVGELYIGGDGLALGYLNSPELTGRKFVPDPFGGRPGARLYRTGDRARYRDDGTIEFLGRIDTQVKIRGFRVEPAEVEAVLRAHSEVNEAAVIARPDAMGGKVLAAYVVGTTGKCCDARLVRELRTLLEDRLPDYMRPATIAVLDRLPLTPNGKLDRAALPAPEISGQCAPDAATGPRDDLERRLAGIWEKILNVAPVGATANFFDLGGHSLLAARLIARVEQEFGVRLSMAALFQAPTVEDLAAMLRRPDARPRSAAVVPMRAAGSRPPFFCVGAGPYLLPLLDRLGPDQPFFGLTLDPSDAARLPVPYRFEDVAACLVRSMREQQPRGPYYLGGWCQSGMMAYEMAQQLIAAGDRVALVVLFDAYNTSYHERVSAGDPVAALSEKLRFQLANVRRLRVADAPQYLAGRVQEAGFRLQRLKWRTCYRLGLNGGRFPELKQIQYLSAGSYEPRPYGGRVALFVPAVRLDGHFDCRKGWMPLVTRGLEVCEIPGDHASMFVEPNVEWLARRMDASLRKAEAENAAR